MSPSGTFVAVLGVGGHGLSIGSFLSAGGTRVVYLDDDPKGVPVEGDSERLKDPAFLKEYQIAIGIGDNAIRVFFSTVVLRHGGRMKMVKHNMATISPTAKKGIGCQYFPGAIVGANAQIGDFVIVNNKASVAHDSIVRDGAQIADGGTLGGGVVIGKCTLIGMNAVVLPKIKVGNDVIVGAGAVVTKDIADGKIVYGNPARSRSEFVGDRAADAPTIDGVPQ